MYDKIQQAQELAESEYYDAALGLLNSLRERDTLTDYETSNVLQHMGSIQYTSGDLQGAISTFSELLLIPGLEGQIRKRIVYTQVQLNSAAERYAEAIGLYEEWLVLEPNPAPAPFIQYVKTLYQLDRYGDMIGPIELALQIAKEREIPVKEDWYVLLSFAYFRQESYHEVRDIQKILLVNWPKKSYWLSLAGTYKEAARLSEGGELDLRLANAYLNLGQYAECAGAVRGGLKKGEIKSPDNAWITLGMCLYNLQKYHDAISSFREAGKTRRSSRIVDQWLAAIDTDIKRGEQIAYAETAVREKLAQLTMRQEAMQ